MTEEPNNMITEGYATLLEAYFNRLSNLTESYKEKVRADFSAANSRAKISMLAGLEQVIGNIESALNVRPIQETTAIFDPQRAAQIRKDSELSQRQLAEIIGSKGPSIVSTYERGKITPALDTSLGTKYLQFLAEKGYNPFGLELQALNNGPNVTNS